MFPKLLKELRGWTFQLLSRAMFRVPIRQLHRVTAIACRPLGWAQGRALSAGPGRGEEKRDAQNPPRVLITGGLGQLGTGLARVLRNRYGNDNVILSDIVMPKNRETLQGPHVYADVLDLKNMHSIVVNNGIDTVIHFSAILSALGEKDVQKALDINITGFHNIIELCRAHNLKLFCPSTIGAFGPDTPKVCPDVTIQRPRTIYGVSKVHVELMGQYYHHRYGLDFRSLRFPGVISSDMPGGGTTDYAIHVFYEVLKHGRYTCFLREDSRLPMIYMDDCLQATVRCLEAPPERIRPDMRTYNIQAMSFTPAELVEEMRRHIPHFEVEYQPDERQQIADSWPDVLEDGAARADLDWRPEYDLPKMVEVMMKEIKKIVASQRGI